MRTSFLWLAILGSFLAAACAHSPRTAAPSPAQSSAGVPTEVPNGLPKASKLMTLEHREATLSNGFRVFMIRYPSPGVVAYQFPVHAGSRNEVEAGKTGFAHFFEHLMFRGTRHRTAKEFGSLYVRLGAENNAWTANDMTNYHGVVATVYLPKILDAEADRFQNLSFSEKALRDEAGAVLGEYHKNVAQPEFQLEEKLAATAFTTHPYGHTTMGYKDDILHYTERYRDVWPFFKRYYRPSNVSLVLVGDFDFDRTLATIRWKFGGWKAPEIEAAKIPAEPVQTAPRRAEIQLGKTTQTRLAIAYKVPAFTTRSTESAALDLLSDMLFSPTSEFQKRYRFDKKWLDSISAPSQESVDPGLWVISLRLSAAGEGKEKELQEAVERTIAEARERAPSAERLAATKQRFRNATILGGFASPESLASRVAWYTNFEPDFEVLDRMIERVAQVSAEQVQAFAQTHLLDARKTVVVLRGPKNGTENGTEKGAEKGARK